MEKNAVKCCTNRALTPSRNPTTRPMVLAMPIAESTAEPCSRENPRVSIMSTINQDSELAVEIYYVGEEVNRPGKGTLTKWLTET